MLESNQNIFLYDFNLPVNRMESDAPHVHFEEVDDNVKNNDIVVKFKREKHIEVQLGFLQVHHVYDIVFPLKLDYLVDYLQKDDPVPNLNCRIEKMEVVENGVQVTIRFKAVKEKLVREKVILENKEDDIKDEIFLEFVARVLGKGKGTPMLRSGIRCVEVLQDPDETEASDWQGFD